MDLGLGFFAFALASLFQNQSASSCSSSRLIVCKASRTHSGLAKVAASKSGRAIRRALFSSFIVTHPAAISSKNASNGIVNLVVLPFTSLCSIHPFEMLVQLSHRRRERFKAGRNLGDRSKGGEEAHFFLLAAHSLSASGMLWEIR